MLKGVNKHIVEINNPNNEYFEKAILYVKANKVYLSDHTLSEQAKKYLDTIGKPKKSNLQKFLFFAMMIICFGLLIAACFFLI